MGLGVRGSAGATMRGCWGRGGWGCGRGGGWGFPGGRGRRTVGGGQRDTTRTRHDDVGQTGLAAQVDKMDSAGGSDRMGARSEVQVRVLAGGFGGKGRGPGGRDRPGDTRGARNKRVKRRRRTRCQPQGRIGRGRIWARRRVGGDTWTVTTKGAAKGKKNAANIKNNVYTKGARVQCGGFPHRGECCRTLYQELG